MLNPCVLNTYCVTLWLICFSGGLSMCQTTIFFPFLFPRIFFFCSFFWFTESRKVKNVHVGKRAKPKRNTIFVTVWRSSDSRIAANCVVTEAVSRERKNSALASIPKTISIGNVRITNRRYNTRLLCLPRIAIFTCRPWKARFLVEDTFRCWNCFPDRYSMRSYRSFE